jgi:hypothetical protein
MISLGYGARVRVPLETNPNAGGGPIRRSPLLVTRSNEGMPPYGYPSMVMRTPHAVVPDMEPGGAYEPQLWRSKFLPDGRIVRAGAMGNFGQSTISAQDALARLSGWYAALQLAAGRIIDVYSKLGRPIPCVVRNAHNQAVKGYRTYGATVFGELAKRNYTPRQQILDQAGKIVKTVEIGTPVLPTTFIVTDCPGGTSLGVVAPALIPLIVAQAGTILRILVIVAGSVVGAAVVARIAFPKPPDPQPVDPLTYRVRTDEYLGCLSKLVAAGSKPEAAEEKCTPILTGQVSPVMPPSKMGPWTIAGIIAGVLVIGSLVGVLAIRPVRRRVAEASSEEYAEG